jgi:sugar/nucleoside kinase (ribokinase family)
MEREYLLSADYLLLDGYHFEAAHQAARWMKEEGKTVVMDGGMALGSRSAEYGDLLSHVDILISGSGFSKALTGISDKEEAGKRILQMGPAVYVQTEGAEGCYTVAADEFFHTEAFSVEVMDTTGAGDTFHGAYLVGLNEGWSLPDTALFASAAAAIKCRRLGGRAGIPDRESVLSFLKKRGCPLSPSKGER